MMVKSTLLLLSTLLSPGLPHAAVQWQRSSMLLAREGQTAALVAGHALLIAGGTVPGELFGTVSASAELFDSNTDTWRFVQPMDVPRIGQVTVSLGNGRVLVAGGQDDSFQLQDSVQIFDIRTATWESAAPLPAPAADQSGIRLPDGNVLVTGGIVNGTASRQVWMFEPKNNRWRHLADMRYPRAGHASALLSRNRVLVFSGSCPWAEIYDTARDRWTVAGRPGARLSAATVKEPGDQVLLADGSTLSGSCLRTAVLYSGGAWKSVPPTSEPRCSPLAAALPDGTALVGGGYNVNTWRTVQRFEPVERRWTAFPSFHIVRAGGTLNLVGGKVVTAGGNAEGFPVSVSETYSLASLPPVSASARSPNPKGR